MKRQMGIGLDDLRIEQSFGGDKWLLSCVSNITVWAIVLTLPCILVGIPNQGDAITHTMYQYHFSRQLWTGDLYPRWLPEANKGYGSPIFFFQYPLPYYVTAFLRPILSFAPTAMREGRELGIYCFLTMLGSGLAAWTWFRNRCEEAASVIGAMVYMSLPYLIGQVLYTRAAIGEFTSFVWMPLILALCDHLNSARFRSLIGIAVLFALLVLSNFMYAIMFMPVVIIYAAAMTKWSKSVIAEVLLALCGSLGIAAIYVVPFIAFNHLLDLGAMARYHGQAELGRNFIYYTKHDVKDGFLVPLTFALAGMLALIVGWYIYRLQRGLVRFALLAVIGLGLALFIPELGPALVRDSGIVVSGPDSYAAYPERILVIAISTLAVGLIAYCRLAAGRADPREHALVVVACAAFFLMLPWSAWLWWAFPQTSVIQYPWRLCSILSVTVAYLFASALNDCLEEPVRIQKGPSLGAMMLLTAATLVGGSLVWHVDHAFRSPITTQVDTERWVEFPFMTFVSPPAVVKFAGKLGTSPYTYDVFQTQVEKGVEARCVQGSGSVSVARLDPRHFAVSARCDESASIEIGQVYFPLWTIASAGQRKTPMTLHSSPDGLIEVSSSPGKNSFEMVLDGGLAEKAGLFLSAISLAVVVVGFGVSSFWRSRSFAYEPGGARVGTMHGRPASPLGSHEQLSR